MPSLANATRIDRLQGPIYKGLKRFCLPSCFSNDITQTVEIKTVRSAIEPDQLIKRDSLNWKRSNQ